MSRLFSLAAILVFAVSTAFAGNGGNEPADALAKRSIFTNDEDKVVYVDFQALNLEVASIEVRQGNHVVLQDDASETPADGIYELHMGAFNPGQYTLEIKTSSGLILKKDIYNHL